MAVKGLKGHFPLSLILPCHNVEEWRRGKGGDEGLPSSHCKLYTPAAELGKEEV